MPVHADPPLSRHLAQRDQDRLAAILSRLASPYDAERATAGLLASMFIARHGLTWANLTNSLSPTGTPADTRRRADAQRDRRRGDDPTWRGYCRRRRRDVGESLNLLT